MADSGSFVHRHADDGQRHDRRAAHRVNVGEGVGGGDAPKSKGSSTMGMKKSVVAISACWSLSFQTAASSAVSVPTSRLAKGWAAGMWASIRPARRGRFCSRIRRRETTR